eukprot:TRINITY_DN49788_c0_g1_i1.p1 TRINITY_DN49788_c0_g1~~TRINITY_DN49788_c0_g1_i1.p1  ORF type:complete len:296 (+),score=44.26 TRINITY_DN49788_c0_g1_i1:25-912(+)
MFCSHSRSSSYSSSSSSASRSSAMGTAGPAGGTHREVQPASGGSGLTEPQKSTAAPAPKFDVQVGWKPTQRPEQIDCGGSVPTFLDTQDGESLAARMTARGRAAFERWRSSWESQESGSACAAATAMSAMRFLGLPLEAWSQARIDREVLRPRGLFTNGVSLEHGTEMFRVLSSGAYSVELRCIEDRAKAEQTLRQDLKAAFGDDAELGRPVAGGGEVEPMCLLANYRRWVGGPGGHWSPIAGWVESEGKVLLMDVNATRCPPHFVPISELVDALCAWNKITNMPRGYVVLRRLN